MTEAEDLLTRFTITDGTVFAVEVKPHEIIIDCAFDSFIEDKWSSRPARILLKDPTGVDLAIQYPGEVGLSHAGDFGGFHKIEASGPLQAAEFFIAFDYGAIRVKRCLLSIEGLDWSFFAALHPWFELESND